MADLKISQLTAATTPLAGTEVLPIVQSSTTVKVAVSDLTAGRAISATAATLSSGNLNFSSTAQRITGDFSNATVANRLMFQTSTTNNETGVVAIPSGTSQQAIFEVNSDSSGGTNGVVGQIGVIAGAEIRLTSGQRGTGTYQPMTFYTGGSERMRVDTSGNVGIGTASPTVKLQTNGAVAIQGTAAFPTSGAGLELYYDTTAGSHIQSYDRTASAWKNLTLNSNTTIFGTAGSERMRIDSSGNITALGVYSATVGATNRDVYVDNTGLIGYVSSIRASKTNIAPLSGTNWLLQLQPVTFNYRKKDDTGYTDEADGPQQYGLIAEDVETVAPDLCYYDEVDGKQELRGINYSRLITPLLKLVQDQQDMIADLQIRLAKLEKKA